MATKWMRRTACPLLLILLLSSEAFASGGSAPVKRQVTVHAETADEKQIIELAGLEDTVKEDGCLYRVSDVTVEEVSVTYKKMLEHKEVSEPFDVDAAYEAPKTITVDGITYTLKNSSVKPIETDMGVEEKEEFKGEISEGSVPKERIVTHVNPVTGKEEEVLLERTSFEKTGTAIERETIPVLFHDYDAGYFLWNGHLIEGSESVPSFGGYEKEILKSIGVTGDVESMVWDGGSFKAGGETVRRALVTVTRTVPVYTAAYKGSHKDMAVYENTYEAPDTKGPLEGEFTVTATYTYVKKLLGVKEAIGASLGILLLALLIVLLLRELSKRRKGKIDG